MTHKLCPRYAGCKPVRVFYEISNHVVHGGGKQIISRMLELFCDLSAPAAPVSLEAVLARDPQAIVTGSDVGATARLKDWQRWPQISAVKTLSLFSISGDFLARVTPRILRGGLQLCEALEQTREHRKKNSN